MASLKLPVNVQVPPFSTSPIPPHHSNSVSVTGLSRFLIMSEEERIDCFQALMGGSRIVKRASKLLDQEWVSAAHGFRM